MSPYPKHITEPIRVKIAQDLILHEFKKLFISLDPKSIDIIKKDIENWLVDGSSYQFAGYRDFWNSVDSIMLGFKLKNIVPYITAENIEWTEGSIDVNQARFTTDFENLNINGNTGSEVMGYFDAGHELYKNEKEKSDNFFDKAIQRADDPVIALFEQSGDIRVLDGNGRLLRALLLGKSSIPAYLGKKLDNNSPTNFWISTGLLMQITKLYEMGLEEESVNILVKLLSNSESAIYEFTERVLQKDSPLKEKVLQKLGDS